MTNGCVRMLYEFIYKERSEKGTKPIIIDASDVLNDGEAVVNAYCENIGVEFKPDMLQWDSAPQEHFRKWPGFHEGT